LAIDRDFLGVSFYNYNAIITGNKIKTNYLRIEGLSNFSNSRELDSMVSLQTAIIYGHI
jgi:hypothetical protein